MVELPARSRKRPAGLGFTLIEMLFAMGILAFGLTALIGVLTVGVSTRRSAEQKSRAALLADEVLQHVERQIFASAALGAAGTASKPSDPLAPVALDKIEGWPGMSAKIEFTRQADDPELLLATISIWWRERGDAVTETFQRIVVRERPFANRVFDRRGNR